MANRDASTQVRNNYSLIVFSSEAQLLTKYNFSVLGTTFVLFASIGNGSKPNPLFAIISMAAITFFCILPFFKEFELRPNEDGVIISTVKDTPATKQLLYFLSLIGGFLLILAELRILVQVLVPQRIWGHYNVLRKLLIPGSIQLEAKAKKASSYKVNRLIRNALSIHDNAMTGLAGESETTFGRALLCYAKSSDNSEEVGGLLWMWKKVWKLEIFTEEGIRLTTHLLAGNLAQFTICLFIISFFICKKLLQSFDYFPKTKPYIANW